MTILVSKQEDCTSTFLICNNICRIFSHKAVRQLILIRKCLYYLNTKISSDQYTSDAGLDTGELFGRKYTPLSVSEP